MRRRILLEAEFNVLWCGQVLPELPTKLPPDALSLVIVGANVDGPTALIEKISSHHPTTRFVLLDGPESHQLNRPALNQDAVTHVPSNTCSETLFSTLRQVIEAVAARPCTFGQATTSDRGIAPTVSCATSDGRASPSDGTLVHQDSASKSLDDHGFSPMEWRVIEQVRAGLPDAEIAQNLGITAASVRTHLMAILRKTQIGLRTHATRRLKSPNGRIGMGGLSAEQSGEAPGR